MLLTMVSIFLSKRDKLVKGQICSTNDKFLGPEADTLINNSNGPATGVCNISESLFSLDNFLCNELPVNSY